RRSNRKLKRSFRSTQRPDRFCLTMAVDFLAAEALRSRADSQCDKKIRVRRETVARLRDQLRFRRGACLGRFRKFHKADRAESLLHARQSERLNQPKCKRWASSS